jgi:hypothetical protein
MLIDGEKYTIEGSIPAYFQWWSDKTDFTNCHTRFYKENRMHLTCAPGSIYTHMIDKKSVIPLQ